MTEETNYNEEVPLTNQADATPVEPLIESKAQKNRMTIGQLLKDKRESKGLNLKTISQQTKIHIGLLESLENNELDKLPSKTYVRGFVKATAKILGLNQEEALDILEETYNNSSSKPVKKVQDNIELKTETARNTLSQITATPLETVKNVTASSSAFLAKAAVIILIVGVVGFNIKNLADRSTEEQLKLPKVLSTIHQKSKPAPKPKVATPETKPVDETAKAEPLKINIIQDKKEALANKEVIVSDVKLKNISLGEKQFKEIDTLTKEQYDEYLPARFRVPASKGVETIFLNATEGDSWVTYKVDDKEIKKYVLRQGRTVFMRGKLIRLFIGNAKSLKVFYNNKLVEISGSTKNIVLPEEAKTKYMIPLFIYNKDGSVETSDEALEKNRPGQEKTSQPAQSNLR